LSKDINKIGGQRKVIEDDLQSLKSAFTFIRSEFHGLEGTHPRGGFWDFALLAILFNLKESRPRW
jgi:hypothetical protein